MSDYSKSNLGEKLKSYLGLPPYNTPSNINYYDPFYYKSLVSQYGQDAVDQWMKTLKNN